LTFINLKISNHLPPITTNYIEDERKLVSFYNRTNKIENYLDQIREKKKNYNNSYRKILTNELKKQYDKIPNNNKQINHINQLNDKNTFTVCTGHQLNLFTGPLYFFYKIIDTIKICEQLKIKYPQYNFVPIFWMASEDHDFDEINYFRINNDKFEWKIQSKGPVGRLKTESLIDLSKHIRSYFEKVGLKNLISVFEFSYLGDNDLSDSTFKLVHSFFAESGLVIIQPDNKSLKILFKEIIKDEIINKASFEIISNTNLKLNESLNFKFKPQVNPREINMFYIMDGLRERIEFTGNVYNITNTNISFSKKEMLDEIENFPEKFSPNALLRPVYQENILPNLSYVGGGSEIAYWLQLKDYFQYLKIPFPILSVRTSILLISKKQLKKLSNLKLKIEDLFLDINKLKLKCLKNNSKVSLDLSSLRKSIEKNFKELNEFVRHKDKSFQGAVKAQEKKQINGINKLEKRLIKAEKRKHNDILNRIELLKNELFPNNSFQERQLNFSTFYNINNNNFLGLINKNIDPFNQKFKVIKY